MPGIKLNTGPLAKSRAGRKADPLNEDLIKALVSHLQSNPYTKDDAGNTRPNVAGPADEFATQGKAASAGRKYAQAVAAQMDKTVRVHVDGNGKNGDAARFTWVVYLPVGDAPATEGETEDDKS